MSIFLRKIFLLRGVEWVVWAWLGLQTIPPPPGTPRGEPRWLEEGLCPC